MNSQPILVSWIDSKGITSDWEFLKEAKLPRPCYCCSIGFLLEDTKDYVVISPNITDDEEQQIVGALAIPRCSILSIHEADCSVPYTANEKEESNENL